MKLELARIRAQGWALSEQQLDLNSRGIAVPLRDRHGTLVGALNITMPMGTRARKMRWRACCRCCVRRRRRCAT